MMQFVSFPMIHHSHDQLRKQILMAILTSELIVRPQLNDSYNIPSGLLHIDKSYEQHGAWRQMRKDRALGYTLASYNKNALAI